MMTLRKLSVLVIAALLVTGISGVSAVAGTPKGCDNQHVPNKSHHDSHKQCWPHHKRIEERVSLLWREPPRQSQRKRLTTPHRLQQTHFLSYERYSLGSVVFWWASRNL